MRHIGHVGRLQFGGQLALPLIASILEPDLHLRFSQTQRGSQTRTLRGAEIPLEVKGGLQLEDLSTREHRPCFLLSLRIAIAMGEIKINVLNG